MKRNSLNIASLLIWMENSDKIISFKRRSQAGTEKEQGNRAADKRADAFAMAPSVQGKISEEILMKDLTGQQFGRLTAACPTQKRQNGSVVWQCRCSCGNTAFVTSAGLSAGKTRSCGCLKKEMMPKKAVKEVVDLTGQRFGRLTVVRFSDEQSCTQQAWECVCDCGNKVVVRGYKLKNGSVKSCGCLRKAYLSSFGSTRANDITGQRFGRLTAMRPTEKRLGSGVVWECRCDCGSIAYVSNTSLKSGDTRSCGCLRREAASKTAKQYFGSCSKK